PEWGMQLALVAELGTALQQEGERELRAPTAAALSASLLHVIQWTLVRALQGQDPAWVDVRLRALAILHRSGGPDSVPLLLALLAAPPERTLRGLEKTFDPDWGMQLRLIHMCGQLDQARALRTVRLPGRESWEAVAPVEFLGRIVLDDRELLSPLL